MNKLYDTSDIIDFGQMNGCNFYWIYRLNPYYLERLIKETDICFINLNHFYKYGKSIVLSHENISNNNWVKIHEIFERFGINNFSGNSKSFTISIEILNELCKHKLISSINFTQFDFRFSQTTLDINTKKLLSSEVFSNHELQPDSFNEIKKLYKSICKTTL